MIMDTSPAPEPALPLAAAWKEQISLLKLEVVDLEGLQVTPSGGLRGLN
jgi:hypothetical protein